MADKLDVQTEQRMNRVTLGLDMYSNEERVRASKLGLDLTNGADRRTFAKVAAAAETDVVAHPAEGPILHVPEKAVDKTPQVPVRRTK